MTDDAIHLSNNPPLVDPEAIGQKYKDDFVAATAILNAEATLPRSIMDAAGLERCAKHVKDARMVAKKLDGHRATEKAVFDAAGKQVQNLFKPRLDKLDATKSVAERLIVAYNRKVEEDQRRRAAEAAERERAEASRRAEAAAKLETSSLDDVAETVMQSAIEAEQNAARLDRVSTGSAADLVRAHTEAGTVSSRASLVHDVTDNAALRKAIGPLGDYFDQASIDKAIRAYIKACKTAGRAPELAGVTFREDRKAIVR